MCLGVVSTVCDLSGLKRINSRVFAALCDILDCSPAELFEPVVVMQSRATEQAAEQALTQPWEAFRDYVYYILEQQAQDLGFSDVLLSPDTGTELFRTEMDRAFRASLQLVDRARTAGAIRPDFDHSDLYLLTNANNGLLRTTQRAAPLGWRRLGDYMLQAFREQGSEPLTPPSPEWTEALANQEN